MKILHTSDWHLGKHLENHSRIEEQENTLEEIIEIANKEDIDMVIIAGDIYDTSNPPAAAEKLLYRTLKKLGNNGERIILIIAGNHDSPDRLVASTPLAYDHGVILLGSPRSTAEIGKIGNHEIVDSGEGYIELEINGERVVMLTLPYPSEQRLNEVFGEIKDQREVQKNYSEKVKEIFISSGKKFREDTINIATSHIFVLGGETSDSERPIQVGGGLTVHREALPNRAQYIALGHLHKPQKVKKENTNVYYSGSPLQYSKSEIGYPKSVYIADIKAGEPAIVEQAFLGNRKPLEVWKCNSVAHAIETCMSNQDREVWTYLEISTDRVLTQCEIKEIKTIKPDILSIVPILEALEEDREDPERFTERNIMELFKEFYIRERNVEPTQDFMEFFSQIIGENEYEEGEGHETKIS